MVDISDRLKQVRKRLGHTQKKMAEMLGVPYRTLQDNERALVQPGAATLAAYAAIGVDLNWLVTGIKQSQLVPLALPAGELRIKKNSVVELKPFSNGDTSTIENQSRQNGVQEVISRELLPSQDCVRGKSDRLVWITQPDGSMVPEIPKGAKLVVDVGSTMVNKTAIYLLRVGGRLVGRHVEETKDGYIVITTADGSVEAVYPATERASIGLLGLVRYVIRPV